MKCSPDVLRLTHSGLKVRPRLVSFFFDNLRMLLVVVTILWTKTQEEPRTLFAAAQIVVTGEGRSSPLVVHADPNTLGDVFDKARRMVKRSQVRDFFVHGCFF